MARRQRHQTRGNEVTVEHLFPTSADGKNTAQVPYLYGREHNDRLNMLVKAATGTRHRREEVEFSLTSRRYNVWFFSVFVVCHGGKWNVAYLEFLGRDIFKVTRKVRGTA
jgi:hypothetical protein